MTYKFRMIPDALSEDTVQCLEQLLTEAKAGRLVGIAFAAILPRRQFIANTAGECRKNPVLTRGIVASLDDELSRSVWP